jgi:transposase
MSALETIAGALGGRAGARLAQALGMAGAPGALLDQLARSDVGRQPHDPSQPLRVVGIDDWAWRKGTRYGTILVDLERRRVIDLLPDREPETVSAWLSTHPTIEFISRDRASAYADAALRGAPQAIQVADRFHLFRNLTETAQRAVERHHARIREIQLESAEKHHPEDSHASEAAVGKRGGPVARPTGQAPVAEERKRRRREQRLARYSEVTALRSSGASVADIHRHVGLSRATIARWLKVGAFPERQPAKRCRTTLSPHAAYLTERWQAGCHNATTLWCELRDGRGFRGGVSTVRDWIRVHLRPGRVSETSTVGELALDAAAPKRIKRPSARQVGWLLTAPSPRLNEAEQEYVKAVCTASPALARVHTLALEYRHMFETRDVNTLSAWLEEAERSELHSLGVSLRRDRDAVLAAIVFPWSNGQVEGQVHRLKLVKRTMYGRANFPLLRRRVLAH